MTGHRQHRPDPVDRDMYRLERKLPSGTHCPGCELVVRKGRWVQPIAGETPTGPEHLCPACQRVRDRYPAGLIEVTGDLGLLAEDLLNLVRHVEAAEREEHPLERLIELTVTEDRLVATTTGGHLARRVGSALERQFANRIQIQYGEEENLVRIVGKL